jgi:hypothetical protein
MKTTAQKINDASYTYRIKKILAKYASNGTHEQGAFCTMYTFDDGSFISFNCDIDIITGEF